MSIISPTFRGAGRTVLVYARALLALACAPRIAWSQASAVQPGFENAGQPRTEFLLGDLRTFIGKKFWVRRPLQGQSPIALFCDSAEAPAGKDCPREKFSVDKDKAFTIEDVAIAKPDPALSWLKIRFDASKKPAHLSLRDYTEHRYNEARVSAALMGIDYTLAHSGWIFNDYPDKILNNRREQLEKNATRPSSNKNASLKNA
ncbi:MAG: hypothetical protein FJY56_03490 [Betaproteobacteria bacterium]|nr:hypothetical protein [Betaproteobacteria bacterium]